MYNTRKGRLNGGDVILELTQRQTEILDIVQTQGPITGERIAEEIGVPKTTLRADLSVLTMTGRLMARPRVGYMYNESHVIDERLGFLHQDTVGDHLAVPVSVAESSSVYDAAVTMFLEDVGTLFVVREAQLLGVLSRKDLLKIALGNVDAKETPVTFCMTRVPHVVSIEPEASLYDAAVLMVRYEVDALPVVRHVENRHQSEVELVGRVSKTTITKAFVDLGRNYKV